MISRIFHSTLIFLFLIPSLIVDLRAENGYHSDSIDVIHYNINLTLTNISSKQIAAVTELIITPKVSNVEIIALDLLQLQVNGVTDGSGSLTYSYNDSLLAVHLSQAISPGDTISIYVDYQGQPILDPSGFGGFYFSGSSYAYNIGVAFTDYPHNYGRVWYPCLDDFVDRATYDYYVTVDDGMKAVCGGSLIGTIQNGDNTQTYHWNQRDEIPTYLSSVAVGNFVEIADTFAGQLGNVPISIYVSQSDSTPTASRFAKLKEVLAHFETYFGPYRFERVGYVVLPFSGGAMEHSTNIAYPQFYVTSVGLHDNELLWAHELAHHWFGNLVTCRTSGDMWINEGWASYFEFLFEEMVYGQNASEILIRNEHLHVLEGTHIQDGGYYAVSGVPHNITYGETVYHRGSLVAHTLRGYMGDSVFFDAMRAFLETYKFADVSSEDFRDFLTSHTGVDMTDFFEGWVFNAGYNHFAVDSFEYVQNGSNYDVTVHVRQRYFERDFYTNSNILELTFMDSSWTTHSEIIEFDGETGSQSYTIPIEPAIVMMDKNARTADATVDEYKTINSTNYTYFSAARARIAVYSYTDSSFVRIEHNYVKPDWPDPPVRGLILSDKHYWKVDGILSDSLDAIVQFAYANTANGIDRSLLGDYGMEMDTAITLLYRPGRGHNWQEIGYIVSGGYNGGNMISDTMAFGEYTFAVWDTVKWDSLRLGYYESDIIEQNKSFNIYPNPSSKEFVIEYNVSGDSEINVYNMTGLRVFSKKLDKENRKVIWQPKNIPSGIYFVTLNENGVITARKKTVYTR